MNPIQEGRCYLRFTGLTPAIHLSFQQRLNIARYISTAIPEEAIGLDAVNQELLALEDSIVTAEQRLKIS